MLTGSRLATVIARQSSVGYPGAIYHLMNRGGRKEPLVREGPGRLRFLETLGKICAKTDNQLAEIMAYPLGWKLVDEVKKWQERLNKRYEQGCD